MATINGILTTFAQKDLVLGYSSTERDRITGSLNQLVKVLKNRLYNQANNVLTFGSYTRNTILPRKFDTHSDVDILVVFDTRNGKKTPGTYRRNILDALSSSYPRSTVKKDFPTVTLELNHIMFDVVPCYSETSIWGNSTTYYIPNANDSWRTTIPFQQKTKITVTILCEM